MTADRHPFSNKSLRYNGVQTQQYILTNLAVSVLVRRFSVRSRQYRVADRLRNDVSANLSGQRDIERQLPAGFVLVSDYTYQRGNHLLRARDIMLRCKETGLRPFSREGNIDQSRIVGPSRGHVLNWNLKALQNGDSVLRTVHALWLHDDTGGLPSASWTNTSAASLFARFSREQRQPAAGVGRSITTPAADSDCQVRCSYHGSSASER